MFYAILSMFAGLMIGISISKKEREKELYYEDLCKLCNDIYINICFRSDKIMEILNKTIIRSNLLNKNLDEYKLYIKQGDLHLSKGLLTSSEYDSVVAFFSNLGHYDGETQLSELKSYQIEYYEQLSKIKKNNEKMCNATIKLGALGGLLIGILLL